MTSLVQSRAGVAASVPRAHDGANGGARRVVGVRDSGGEIRRAAAVMPVGRVVALHAEVRSAHDFEVVGQAGVSDGKVIRGEIGGPGVLVDEPGVRIVENLSVTMVFHHDHENMVEMRDTLGHGAFLRHRAPGESGQQAQS